MSECVILFERLSNLLGMLNDCYTPEGFSFTENEDHFLGFFNPLVNDFRNINIHEYYDSHISWDMAVKLEGQIHDKRFRDDIDTDIETIFLAELTNIINGHLSWFEETEVSFSSFFEFFFGLLADKLNISEHLVLPKHMPENFKVKYQRTVNLRRNNRHTKTFNTVNNQD